MRLLLVLGSISVAALTGCAASVGGAGPERSVVVVDADPARARTSSEVVEVTEVVQPIAPEAAQARPRLAQTVTLGQGTSEAPYAGPAPQQAAGAPGGNVVVNNNITVVGGTPGYGGYGYYGGYGGYGYGYGSSGARDHGRGSGSTSRGSGAWAPSGWEGAGRTAAPGHTPGVGGNWAPPSSHGPRQMK
jgi:hypothetical protein